LSGSKYVNGSPEILVRILVNGKDGSIGEMPPLGSSLSDDQLAAVLTYIRGSFGNTSAPIHTVEANEYREMNAYRKKPWTEKELDSVPRRAGGGAQ
jgi:mono/diheme cytochrome c family protein